MGSILVLRYGVRDEEAVGRRLGVLYWITLRQTEMREGVNFKNFYPIRGAGMWRGTYCL